MATEHDQRVVVVHLLERAGLPVNDDEIDELMRIYSYNRMTAAMLYTDDVKDLLK
jgi:hypothetical protein